MDTAENGRKLPGFVSVFPFWCEVFFMPVTVAWVYMCCRPTMLPCESITEIEKFLMENRSHPDGGVGSDVGTCNAEIYLITANSLKNRHDVTVMFCLKHA